MVLMIDVHVLLYAQYGYYRGEKRKPWNGAHHVTGRCLSIWKNLDLVGQSKMKILLLYNL